MIWITGATTRTQLRSRTTTQALSLQATTLPSMDTVLAELTAMEMYGIMQKKAIPSQDVRCPLFSGM